VPPSLSKKNCVIFRLFVAPFFYGEQIFILLSLSIARALLQAMKSCASDEVCMNKPRLH